MLNLRIEPGIRSKGWSCKWPALLPDQEQPENLRVLQPTTLADCAPRPASPSTPLPPLQPLRPTHLPVPVASWDLHFLKLQFLFYSHVISVSGSSSLPQFTSLFSLTWLAEGRKPQLGKKRLGQKELKEQVSSWKWLLASKYYRIVCSCPEWPLHKDKQVKVKWSHSGLSDSASPWTVAHQAPPSMEFSRHEYCSGLPFPSHTRVIA